MPLDRHETPTRWKVSLLNSAHAVGHIINALERSGCAERCVGDKRPVGDALRHLRNHRERMGYSAARPEVPLRRPPPHPRRVRHRAAAEARLGELGVALPPARRRLPPATAQPGLPFAA